MNVISVNVYLINISYSLSIMNFTAVRQYKYLSA